jgi:hypothetical protein
MAGILDPVNEGNCIGGQTFSIKEIQEEWRLSLTALKFAMQEYTSNTHEGREKSLLASIVGLTTRYRSLLIYPSLSLSETPSPSWIS